MKPFVTIVIVFLSFRINAQNTLQTYDLSSSDTLPFILTENNNIVFQSVLNDTDTLKLFFDTGATDLVLKQNVIDEHGFETFKNNHSFSLNDLHWDSLTIYPARIGPEDSDGHFGWDLFNGKIVEIDYEKKLMIVYPALFSSLDEYTQLPIEYTNTLFCIRGSIRVGKKVYSNRYLFDTGFQRSIILDKKLRKKARFPRRLPVLKETRLKNSAGKEFINQVVEVDEFCFNELCVDDVPVQLLSTPNPARFETHILGGEFLKRFNTILDFQHGYVYLKANKLLSEPYMDKA